MKAFVVAFAIAAILAAIWWFGARYHICTLT